MLRMPKKYAEIDFDSDEATEASYRILREKKCLRDIYEETYRMMVDAQAKHLTPGRDVLEIGSGGGFIKDIYPYVITSDVKKSRSDLTLSAESLPFPDQSLDAIFAMHVLHHIPDVRKFFGEAVRTLRPGGGLILIEPYHGPLARYIYKRVHPEPFDEHAPNWTLDPGGPMSGSNQAMSYLVFKRDYNEFRQQFPTLRLVKKRPFGFARYIATGGLWLKPRIPSIGFPILRGLEFLLRPAMPWIALHHMLVVRKDA